MPTFAAFLAAMQYNPRGVRGLHASLQNPECFVYAPPVIPPPPSVPTQQIVIMSSSTCTVSYGGSR